MNSPATAPVVLLIFANSRYGDDRGFLRGLVAERRIIRAALSEPEADGICRVEWEQNVTRHQLFDLLDKFQDDIIGVHFGGHADPRGLVFEDDDGRPSAGLIDGVASRLERLPRLRWVFLNGCGTAAHIAVLHQRVPVPLVATETAIRDDVAVEMARRFYHGLAHRQCIRDAFDNAESAVRTAHRGPLDVVRGPGEDALRLLRPGGEASPWPWILAVPPDDPASVERGLFDARATQGLDPRGGIGSHTVESWPPPPPHLPDDAHGLEDTGERTRPLPDIEQRTDAEVTLEGRGRTSSGSVADGTVEQSLPLIELQAEIGTVELSRADLEFVPPAGSEAAATGRTRRDRADLVAEPDGHTTELSRSDLEWVGEGHADADDAVGTVELSRSDIEVFDEPPDASRMDHAVIISRKSILGASGPADDDAGDGEDETTAPVDPHGETIG